MWLPPMATQSTLTTVSPDAFRMTSSEKINGPVSGSGPSRMAMGILSSIPEGLPRIAVILRVSLSDRASALSENDFH